MRRGISFLAALALLACLTTEANAGPIYSYAGNLFTTVNNPSPNLPTYSTSDFVSGFVEFATAPTPGEIGKFDVIDFSFTTGPVTITPASSPLVVANFSFDFDASLSIVMWAVEVAGDGAGPNVPNLITTDKSSSSIFDQGVAELTNFGNVGSNPGTWSFEAVALVPEPSSFTLLGIGCVALLSYGWRKRRSEDRC